MDDIEPKEGLHVPHSSKKEIFYAAIVLTLLTALEFLIAFTMGDHIWRVIIFLGLTVLKAFYIVAYFMHLRHERINLAYSIIIPIVLVVYFVVLLIYEGLEVIYV